MKKYPTSFLLMIILFFHSCSGNETKTAQQTASELTADTFKYLEKHPEADLSNARFREKVMPTITNPRDHAILDSILLHLDKVNLSFCRFVQRQLEIDDSCYAVAKRDYPDPSMQKDFIKRHDIAIKLAQPAYLKSLNMEARWADIAVTAYEPL